MGIPRLLSEGKSIPIVYRGSWTNKPAADAVPVGSTIHIQDTWTLPPGLYFVSDGTWWRPLNGSCLLYQWDLSALSYTSTTLGVPAGYTSPTFPWSYLMKVPGFQMDTFLVAERQSPANTQSVWCAARLAGGVYAAAVTTANTNTLVKAAGSCSYKSQAVATAANGNSYQAYSASAADFIIADGGLELLLATGGAGETMLPKTMQILYKA